MAEPFSIVASTFGLLDICIRTGKYLRNVNNAAKGIEGSLTSLIEETDALRDVNEHIKTLWKEYNGETQADNGTQPLIKDYWTAVQKSQESCTTSIASLERKVGEIIGKDGKDVKSKLDGIKKTLRKQSRESEIQILRTEVMGHRYSLQMLLQVLTFSYSQHTQAAIGRGLQNLSDEVLSQGFNLQREVNTLLTRTEFMESEHYKLSVATAAKAVSSVRLNKHFYLPRPVNSLYTGREDMLTRVQHAISTAPASNQRRFVIYGLGGSGKTEFCCKFAQNNRNSFWGIFSVDGKSERTIHHGFANIAKLAGLGKELGERADIAGRNWLANLELPWLLIIDNVDSLSIDELSKHFPAGERGVILITTRTPDLRVLGTTSPGFLDFGRELLDGNDSNELLLRAAEEKRRSEEIWEAATKIARRLGYLPLALIQAGKAILQRISTCTLENYLDLYEQSWNQIRRSISRDPSHTSLSKDGIVNMSVYSTYEISFRGLQHTKTVPAQDAVDLLKLFSFFSNEKIQLSILTTAVSHARRRQEYDASEAERISQTEGHSLRWYIKTAYLWYLRQIDKSGPLLPRLLRDENFDVMRLGDALYQLQTLALISYHDEEDSYSMHTLVHTYIREQPEMKTSEQALWCEMASSVLAQSILLPPLDTIPSAEELKRHILPHVAHVQRFRKKIWKRLAENAESRWRPWKSQGSALNRQLAWTYAKFSLIYYSNGLLRKAAKLQLQVLDFIKGRLGEDNEAAWLIKLFLSQTYAMQTNFNRAGDLQDEVLRSSMKILGRDHIQTLKYMVILGATRAFQARLKESKQLLQTAVTGLTKALGETADEVFDAKQNLGRTMRRYADHKACYSLHKEAFEGFSKSTKYGPDHEKTWEAGEDLAMSMLDLAYADLKYADQLARNSKRERKKKFGTEHPLTLLSRCNLARVESARGFHEKAEKIIRKHLPTAINNLGEYHFGSLMGRSYLALVVGRQKRYEEAEEIFKVVTDQKHYARAVREDGEHIDRLYALRLLMEMYIEWGKFQDASKVCDELEDGVARIGGEKLGLEHPIMGWLARMREKISQLERNQGNIEAVEELKYKNQIAVLLDDKLRKRSTGL